MAPELVLDLSTFFRSRPRLDPIMIGDDDNVVFVFNQSINLQKIAHEPFNGHLTFNNDIL